MVGSGAVDLDHRQGEPEQQDDARPKADCPQAVAGRGVTYAALKVFKQVIDEALAKTRV